MLQGFEVPESGYKLMRPHIRDFIDCVKTRRKPVSGVETSQRAHTIAHCSNLCLRLGRKLNWDPAAERFVNDDEANRMMFRAMRAPWRV